MKALYKTVLAASGVMALLSGCGGENGEGAGVAPAKYSIEIKNLSNFQPISPIGIGLHADGHFFTLGEPASVALEKLAEGGDNSELLASTVTSVSMSGPLLPGQTTQLEIEKGFGVYHLSAIGMLVNTNDGFTGLDSVDVDAMKVGDQQHFRLNAYDAGTEANTKAAGTIPGPADGGEGFNATRNDVDVVSMHAGVVTKDDGLVTSVLTQEAKFDNPVAELVITRIK